MKKLLIAAIAILLLSGCVETRIKRDMITGDSFTMADVEALQPGITTLEEAKTKLGKPFGYDYKDNGEIGVTWSHSHFHAGGDIITGMTTSNYTVSTGIRFSKDGIMVRIVSKQESRR